MYDLPLSLGYQDLGGKTKNDSIGIMSCIYCIKICCISAIWCFLE